MDRHLAGRSTRSTVKDIYCESPERTLILTRALVVVTAEVQALVIANVLGKA